MEKQRKQDQVTNYEQRSIKEAEGGCGGAQSPHPSHP